MKTLWPFRSSSPSNKEFLKELMDFIKWLVVLPSENIEYKPFEELEGLTSREKRPQLIFDSIIINYPSKKSLHHPTSRCYWSIKHPWPLFTLQKKIGTFHMWDSQVVECGSYQIFCLCHQSQQEITWVTPH